jgi:acetate kinase
VILVVNAGSSSVKIALFDEGLREVIRGAVTEIGATGELTLGAFRQPVRAADHDAALSLLLAVLRAEDHPPECLTASAHRVVHGGATLTAPCRLDATALAAIEACLPQFASFDTAFHATNPPVATTYALPKAFRDAGLRRYGFHGISYQSLVERLQPLPRRLLALHLGNGASLCAILDGRSVATSMGYSPLEGLVMGTRTGQIDGMAVLEIARAAGLDRAADILNRESGLKALAGTSDMATILQRDDAEARFAAEMFCYWAIRQAGSAIAAMGGLDALAFTGGIGEHAAPIRERIVEGLAWAGSVPLHVVPAQEERRIAQDAAALLRDA